MTTKKSPYKRWCRAPYGARGLKCKDYLKNKINLGSRPVWGAWIEMSALR